MKTKDKSLVDWSQITIDPNLKSSRHSPFVVKKVEEARQMLEKVDLSILKLSRRG